MLGCRRPPDHKRRHLPECWRVGITAVFPLVSYRFCFTYTFIPSSLSRPLNPLSPRMHSVFSLADRPYPLLRPWFNKTNASPTSMIIPSFLGPPWPARPGHLHPVVHRLTKGPSTYIDHLIGRVVKSCRCNNDGRGFGEVDGRPAPVASTRDPRPVRHGSVGAGWRLL